MSDNSDATVTLTIEPPEPRPCQSVLVSLRRDGHNVADDEVTIQGLPGAERWMQFPAAGVHSVTASYSNPRGTIRLKKDIVVRGSVLDVGLSTGGSYDRAPALLSLRQELDTPYVAQFTLGGDDGRRRRSSGRSRASGGLNLGFPLSGLALDPTTSTNVSPSRLNVEAFKGGVHPSEPAPGKFHWSLGQGTMIEDASSSCSHDYWPDLDPEKVAHLFIVECRVPSEGLHVRRTLTLVSTYGISRRKGFCTPRTSIVGEARNSRNGLRATIDIENIEDHELTLSERSVVPRYGNPSALDSPIWIDIREPLRLPAKSKTRIPVLLPEWLSASATAVHVQYAGTSAEGLKVRCGAVIDVPLGERHASRALGAGVDLQLDPDLAGPVGLAGELVDEMHELESQAAREVTVLDLRSRELPTLVMPNAEGTPVGRTVTSRQIRDVAYMLNFGNPGARDNDPAPVPFPPSPGQVFPGQVCDPINPDPNESDLAEARDLYCAATDETVRATIPAGFLNAQKGDIVISPGGPGIIGGLLRQVDPPQWWSHCGIMTRNYDEIAHSTASEQRMTDDDIGLTDTWPEPGGDGIRPEVLRWLWPGAVAQSVEAAVEGEAWTDPSRPGKRFSISSFKPDSIGVTHGSDFVLVPPSVIKPDPRQETPGIRSELHVLGQSARSLSAARGEPIKTHYSFYSYTDPTTALTYRAPAESGWASGTWPSVCSSFIWYVARDRVQLESKTATVSDKDLELEDRGRVEVRSGSGEGLYLYRADERRRAGDWLYERVYGIAAAKAGDVGVFLTDAADDIANQVVNAFALNSTEKDSNDWQNTSDAVAVSPDDMLSWDSVEAGGVYGFVEPLAFRPSRVEEYHINRWEKFDRTSSVTVETQGPQGRSEAGVSVLAGDKRGTSDAGGRFIIERVPRGYHTFSASKAISGVLWKAEVRARVSDDDELIVLRLEPPDEDYRRIQIDFSFFGQDYENFTSNETHEDNGRYIEFEMGPQKRRVNRSLASYRFGGEIRATYTLVALLADNRSVSVTVSCRFFEGGSEDTDDLDGVGSVAVVVAEGDIESRVLRVSNTDEDEPGDFVELSISVRNSRAEVG